MVYFPIASFVVSLLLTLIIIRSASRHQSLSADRDLTGPQKFHSRAVPRIGGIGVFAAMIAGAWLAQLARPEDGIQMYLLLGAALPAFGAGLAEDLTKRVSPRRRLLFTAVSAALGIWLVDATILRSAIPGIDYLIAFTPFAMLLTVFVVTGVANAVNIIDGFNGLASMCVVIMMLAIAYVAFQVGDEFVMLAALSTAGAILGFFVWNFPAGLIFLGDGGAYFLGFILAELSILLFRRNVAVSPLFTLLLCAYPIFETLFSIYRKRYLRGISPGIPDGVHLHMLIYRRLIRWAVGDRGAKTLTRRNSMTSPYLWLLCLFSVIPAVLWWNNSAVLTVFLFLFMVSYVLLYWSIVRFKSPKWLVVRRHKW
ncbi:MAG: glycosyl transferase [Acidobacteriales bacterium]|nr:glycosyl transferase [Terriglobales bacterium]